MNAFTFNTTKSVVFRNGAIAELARLGGKVIGRRCLFITDKDIVRLGLCTTALASLREADVEVLVFDEVEPDPHVTTVHKAVDAGRQIGATSVIGFGGGSCLDVAKVAALLLGSGESLDDAWGAGKASGPRLPLLLIPTTAGTGSEVTPVAIITVGANEKRAISAPVLLPDMAVLDPNVTIGLPPAITAATGVDAMVHAIESFASKSPNNNPVTRMMARAALRELGQHLETAVFQGDNIAARCGMLLGSFLAGQAFANSPVAAVHALAYPIGGGFHVAHGTSNALVLPHVLRFNAPEAAELYSEIAADVFPALAIVEDVQVRCEQFIQALAALISTLGLPTLLRQVGIVKTDLPGMAKAAMHNSRLLDNNPRLVTEADALAIYEAAW